MNLAIRLACRAVVLSLALTAMVAAIVPPVAGATVRQPDCAALESWALAIDRNDRWQPIDGKRIWLPRAFEGAAFESLFGAEALDWSADDVKAMGVHLDICAKAAFAAKRNAERKALLAARGDIVGRLKGVLGQVARARVKAQAREQKQARREALADTHRQKREVELDAALDELLGLPDSPELLRALAMLRAVDFADPESYGPTYGRVPVPSGRRLLAALRSLETDNHDPRVADRMEARFTALHETMLGGILAEIEGLNDSTRSLQILERKPAAIRQQLGAALSAEDEAQLGAAIADKRQSIRLAIVARGRRLIDEAGSKAAAVQRIQKLVDEAATAGLTPQQVAELRAYGRARQQDIGDAVLQLAATRFADYPSSLAGMEELRAFVKDTVASISRRASRPAMESFRRNLASSLTTMAEGALPEFEQNLAALDQDRDGLQAADAQLAAVRGWRDVGAEVRERYVEAARARRSEIAAMVLKVAQAQRQAAIAAGGDPALVGYRFVDAERLTSLEFRDERRVIFSALGMRFAGIYELSQDDVIVEGPNGSIVFARDGDRLSGMGLVLIRSE